MASFLCRAALLLTLLAPLTLAYGPQEMHDMLANAIRAANAKAALCGGRAGCFGAPVSLVLPAAVQILQPLPPLAPGAVLNIKGACGNFGLEMCVIDGQKQYAVFTTAFPGPGATQGSAYSKLRLNNLIFQNARGGVFVRMAAEIVASFSIFQNNVGGVELGNTGSVAGNPARYFLNCQFLYNTGGVISADNGLYGLARDTVGYYVKNSAFIGNKGTDGAAVMVSGDGTSTFENCIFQNNIASGSGGAVYAESTTVVFRRTSFVNNVALKGAAGAVSGATSDDGGLAASFCSCTFAGNRALLDARAASLAFHVANPGEDEMSLKFCNSTAAVGTRLPKNTIASVQIFSTQRSALCIASC